MDAPRASPWIAFSAVAVGTFMATLDGNIVGVALPTIGRELDAAIPRLEWIVNAYLLALSATLLAMGRLGDVLGHRAVYVAGLAVFTAGSMLCGAAPTLGLLQAARVIQAFGASAMMAIGPATITAAFPRERRGRALGAFGSVVALGLTAGPPLGGLVLSHLSWRWVFYVNLPVGILGALWALRVLPGRPRAPAGGARFDLAGAALLAIALAAGLLAVDGLTHPAPAVLAPLAVAAAAGGALWARERRIPAPLVDGALLRNRTLTLGLVAGFLSYAAMFSQTFLTPFFLTRVLSLPPARVGLGMAAVPVALSVASPVAGWIADRFGPRVVSPAAMLLLAAGLWLVSRAGPGDGLAGVMARLAVCGAAMGLFQAPNNAAVMSSLPRERLGAGGGLLATARNLGMAVGTALAGGLFALRASADAGGAAFLDGWALALQGGAVLALLAALASTGRATFTATGA